MTFEYFPKNSHMLDSIAGHPDVQQLIRFSQGFYTVDNPGDTILFNDLRFGQITGWHTPRGRFAFYYYLQYPDSNELVVQRGRFANWTPESAKTFLRRICGN